MVKYIVPLIRKNNVIKPKYDIKRDKGVKVHFDIPAGVVIVTSEKEIEKLEGKEDVKVVKE